MSNRKVCVKCNLLFEEYGAKQLLNNCSEESKICKFCLSVENKGQNNNIVSQEYKRR